MPSIQVSVFTSIGCVHCAVVKAAIAADISSISDSFHAAVPGAKYELHDVAWSERGDVTCPVGDAAPVAAEECNDACSISADTVPVAAASIPSMFAAADASSSSADVVYDILSVSDGDNLQRLLQPLQRPTASVPKMFINGALVPDDLLAAWMRSGLPLRDAVRAFAAAAPVTAPVAPSEPALTSSVPAYATPAAVTPTVDAETWSNWRSIAASIATAIAKDGQPLMRHHRVSLLSSVFGVRGDHLAAFAASRLPHDDVPDTLARMYAHGLIQPCTDYQLRPFAFGSSDVFVPAAAHVIERRAGGTPPRAPISSTCVLNTDTLWTAPPRRAAAVAHDLHASLLQLYDEHLTANGGHVDYAALRTSTAFESYVRATAELQCVDVHELQNDDRPDGAATLGTIPAAQHALAAFFINLYNALVIHATVLLGAPTNTRQRLQFFANVGYRVGPYIFTLDDMEHGVLRGNRRHPYQLFPRFVASDPRRACALPCVDARVHAALVCGARSCPPIKLYDANNLDEALTLAARTFMSDPENFRLVIDGVDVTSSPASTMTPATAAVARTAHVTLSRILYWYAADFGADQRAMLVWCCDYIPRHASLLLHAVLHGAVAAPDDRVMCGRACARSRRPAVSVSFADYDWTSNGTATAMQEL